MLPIVVALFAQPLRAAERYEFYKGIREMGMGGAAIGVVDDQTALLTNPAALSKLRDVYVTVADPIVDVGAQDGRIAGDLTKLPKMLDPQKALDQLNARPGEHLHLGGQVFPSIVMPDFGIGILGHLSVDGQVDKTKTNFDYNYRNDFALVTGFSFRLFDGILKVGANARMINRAEVAGPLAANSTDLSLDRLRTEGVGLASDVGMLLTAPVRYLPSLALVMRDVGDTAYSLRRGYLHKTADRPDRTLETLDGAFSFSPILGKRWRSQFTFEVRDIRNAYGDDNALSRLHGGAEFGWADALFLRGGLNEGYWTAGIEFAVDTYQLQLASYGEEVGEGGARQEDRRYVGSFSFRF